MNSEESINLSINKLKKVSIIIPVYNVASFIIQCLDSVRSQSYTNLEVILVDDCGTDNSMAVVQEYLKHHSFTEVKILHHTHNRGLSAARNTGLEAATGEYVFFLDSDDELTDDCISVMAEPIEKFYHDFVIANYEVKGTVLEGVVKPYVVLERAGVRIGVFGLSPALEGLVQAHCYGDVVFKDPIEAAQQVADVLKEKEKCDLVVCLSHLGWQGEPYSDEALIPRTRNIDIVLGGHSHSYFDKTLFYKNLDGKEIPLQQMGKNAVYVGRMKVTLEKN